MTTQSYLMINLQSNVVDNCVLWDGNTDVWQPPQNYLLLVDSETPALIWEAVSNEQGITVDFILVETMGTGDIGFIWNPTTQVLTTNQPKPEIPPLPPTE